MNDVVKLFQAFVAPAIFVSATAALVRDRLSGSSLTMCSKKYSVSRASVIRFVRDAQRRESELARSEPMVVEPTAAIGLTA